MMKIATWGIALMTVVAGLLPKPSVAAQPFSEMQDTVERGVWCSDFNAAKDYADEHNVPMLVFWANPNCTYCEALERACNKSDFKAWQAERQLVMAFGYGTSTKADAACKEFAKNPSGNFPYMAVYWRSNTKGDEVLEKFSGRSGDIRHGASDVDPVQIQLMTAVDNILPDWQAEPDPDPEPVGGTFLVPDTKGSRLESIAGVTKSVEVPLVRTNATCAVTNIVEAGGVTQRVVWAVGQYESSVHVATASLAEGEDLPLALYFGNEVVGRSAIHGVADPANAPINPKFLGEEIDVGQWTVDYQAARAYATAHPGTRLMVMFSGPLWCPYCIGIETSFLTTEAFKTWMGANSVVPVLMEQGRASSPATARGELGPRLVTYVPDPKKVGSGEIVSGAAYRSRKGVTESAAQQLIAQTTSYTAKWLAPSSTAARLGNPTILLVDPKTEEVLGRFNGYREGYVYDTEENVARLDALLAQPKSAEPDRYPQTTTRSLSVDEPTGFTMMVNAPAESFALDTRPGRVTVVASPDDGSVCIVDLVRGGEIVASGTNAVDGVVSASDIAAGMAVRVSRTFAKGSSTSVAGSICLGWEAVSTDNVYARQALNLLLPMARGGETCGTLTVKTTKKGVVTARYFDAFTQKTVSMSSKWSEPDEVGCVTAVASKNKGSVNLWLELSPTGELTADIQEKRTEEELLELTGHAFAEPIDYDAYAGTLYTVVLPVEKSVPKLSAGAGHIIVRANTSTTRKYGRASCTVYFPNGKSKTVTGQMQAGENGFADMTLVVKSGKETLIVPLQIRPNALLAPTHRAIVSQSGHNAVWTTKDTKLPFVASCGVYGSRYDKKESLVNCCGTENLVLTCDWSGIVMGDKYAPIVGVAGDGALVKVTETKMRLDQKIRGVSLSFSRSTGIVNGKVVLALEDGKTLPAKFKGVVFHDWHDCGCFDDDEGLPLVKDLATVCGTCIFTDKLAGISVQRGISFSLIPIPRN